jgi:hypothetical protein
MFIVMSLEETQRLEHVWKSLKILWYLRCHYFYLFSSRVPSRDSNSGLLYSKPTRYCQSPPHPKHLGLDFRQTTSSKNYWLSISCFGEKNVKGRKGDKFTSIDGNYCMNLVRLWRRKFLVGTESELHLFGELNTWRSLAWDLKETEGKALAHFVAF